MPRDEGLRYSSLLESLPEDGRTLFDSFETRLRVDQIWRSRDELKLVRRYHRYWALVALIALLPFVGILILLIYLRSPFAFNFGAQFFMYPILCLGLMWEFGTREYRFVVDRDGVRWGKRRFRFEEIADVELKALMKGWPATYIRLILRDGKPPLEIFRAHGALSAFVIYRAVQAMLRRFGVADGPSSSGEGRETGPEPRPDAAPAGEGLRPAEAPDGPRGELGALARAPALADVEIGSLHRRGVLAASVSKERPGHAVVEPAVQNQPVADDAERPIEPFARPSFRDRGYSWDFVRRGDGGWSLRCRPLKPFRPVPRLIVFGVLVVGAILLYANMLICVGIPITLVALLVGLASLRGWADRKAEVDLRWDGEALALQRPGQEPRRIDPAQVLAVELDEAGERLWVKLQLREEAPIVAAATHLRPLLELRERLLDSLEGAG